MRKYRFRAWDPDSKIMGISFGPFDPVFMSSGGTFDDNTIIMQSTGLKDKNGVEIFEGDIVRFLDGSYVSTENGIDTNEFMSVGKVEWCDERKGWDVTNREDVQTDECFDEYMEVIGNIYQNPELLKP